LGAKIGNFPSALPAKPLHHGTQLLVILFLAFRLSLFWKAALESEFSRAAFVLIHKGWRRQ